MTPTTYPCAVSGHDSAKCLDAVRLVIPLNMTSRATFENPSSYAVVTLSPIVSLALKKRAQFSFSSDRKFAKPLIANGHAILQQQPCNKHRQA